MKFKYKFWLFVWWFVVTHVGQVGPFENKQDCDEIRQHIRKYYVETKISRCWEVKSSFIR